MRRIVTVSVLALLVVIGAGGVIASAVAPAMARQPATATPLSADFPTFTLTPEGGVTATPSRTPTPPGLAYAEAIDEANVRSGPSTDFDRLGSIYNGEKHVVLGIRRGYPWVKIQFADSPNGEAWVYSELVELSGNVEAIPLIEPEEVPTQNPQLIAMQQTVEILTLTPGAVGTATAIAGLFPTNAPTEAGPTATRPPTFTPPPLGTPQFPQQGLESRPGGDSGLFGLPPAIPIFVLTVLGGLGLIVSLVRRLS